MKFSTLFLMLISVVQLSFSQTSNVTSAEISAFKKSKLYVVLYGGTSETNVKYSFTIGDSLVNSDKKNVTENVDSEYNKAIKWAMKNVWNTTKDYEFITEADFEEKKLENGGYFLLPVKIKTLDKVPVILNELRIVKGGPKSKKIEKMPFLASITLSYNTVSDQYYNYKLAGILQFLQNHMEYVFLNGPQEDKKVQAYYNSKSKEIKHGVLYVLQDDLSEKVFTIDEISKIYKGEVKIVEQSVIESAIKKQDQSVLFLHKISPESTAPDGFCRKYILSAKGGELLYINEHNISKSNPDGLLQSDFKSFNK